MPKWILANWKQNGDLALLQAMVAALKKLPQDANKTIGILPPFVYLSQAKSALASSAILLGAQNVSAHLQGAYTGEISAKMLIEVGCELVLVGHSERRQLYNETDEVVAEKFFQAAQAGLTPVLCVGETLAAYEADRTQEVVRRQIDSVDFSCAHKFIIAYEPIWAIGTGKAATKEQAQAVHAFIRSILAEKCSAVDVASIPLLYGGSVKAENAADFMAMPEIDGVLVGGASLVPEQFLGIIG